MLKLCHALRLLSCNFWERWSISARKEGVGLQCNAPPFETARRKNWAIALQVRCLKYDLNPRERILPVRFSCGVQAEGTITIKIDEHFVFGLFDFMHNVNSLPAALLRCALKIKWTQSSRSSFYGNIPVSWISWSLLRGCWKSGPESPGFQTGRCREDREIFVWS